MVSSKQKSGRNKLSNREKEIDSKRDDVDAKGKTELFTFCIGLAAKSSNFQNEKNNENKAKSIQNCTAHAFCKQQSIGCNLKSQSFAKLFAYWSQNMRLSGVMNNAENNIEKLHKQNCLQIFKEKKRILSAIQLKLSLIFSNDSISFDCFAIFPLLLLPFLVRFTRFVSTITACIYTFIFFDLKISLNYETKEKFKI